MKTRVLLVVLFFSGKCQDRIDIQCPVRIVGIHLESDLAGAEPGIRAGHYSPGAFDFLIHHRGLLHERGLLRMNQQIALAVDA